ncbi:MAG: hypothetical protein M3Y41_06900, partial [Pseudomonadota bacterium]|nr:hypothetical protein [Pseudomonadota bacterium]
IRGHLSYTRVSTTLTDTTGCAGPLEGPRANRFLPDARYGWVCDAATLERLGTLSVETVHQEHGTVPVPDESWFECLPVGSAVRILPNHACLTCAAYPAYDVMKDGTVVDRWARVGGW